MTVSRSIHVSTNDPISFFYVAQEYSIVYMYYIFFIHSSVDGHLGCFHVLAIVIVLLWTLGCMYLFKFELSPDICPGVGLLDHVLTLWLIFFKSLHAVFYSGCIILQSRQQCIRVPISPCVILKDCLPSLRESLGIVTRGTIFFFQHFWILNMLIRFYFLKKF